MCPRLAFELCDISENVVKFEELSDLTFDQMNQDRCYMASCDQLLYASLLRVSKDSTQIEYNSFFLFF